VLYLLSAAIAATILLALVAMHERRLRRRQQAIRELLDGADALEAQLQECRERMQHLRDMLTILPAEMSARADSALSADAKVQAALKDLLAHRLWIKRHAADATPLEIRAAREALAQSGTTLAALLQRLADIGGELQRAQAGAQAAGRRRS
jgi:uncharacterized protein YukE